MTPARSQKVLNPLRTRLAGWLALRVTLALSATLGALALAAVLLDAIVDLPQPARLAAPWVLTAAALGLLAGGIAEWRRLSEKRVARLFERAHPQLGNRLIIAVQLASQNGDTPVEEFFRREAVDRGRHAAAGLKAWPVMQRGLKRMGVFLGSAALAWVTLIFAGNDLLHAVIPRFLDPHGDHPPYSRLKITVAPGPTNVLYGGQVEIRARTSGPPVDKLWLVARTGTNLTRTVMFLAPDRSFFQTLANVREPTEYFVTDNSARSLRYPIHVRFTPQITLVEVSEVYPQYTGKPPHTGKLSGEPEALPAGTRVTFRVASNRPLQSGTLELTPVLGGKTLQVPLQPEARQQNVVTGRFALAQPTAFKLSVRDVAGLDCADPRRGRFNILPDERPRLFVLEPGRDAVATPEIRVPVRVEATDDYGITRVVWLRGFNESIERPFTMKLDLQDGARSVETKGAFNLAALGVRPGDTIQYYFEAADNDPAGPHVVFSRPFRLEIISREQYAAILRQAAARKALFEPYLKLGAWLRRLAEQAHTLASQPESAQASTTRAGAEKLEKELAQYEQELGQLLQEPAMFDVEQSFRTALVVQHTRVGSALARLRKALGSGVPDPKELKALSHELDALASREQEQVTQPAQHIAAVARVLAKADAFVRLARQQATLANMLRRYSDRTNALSRIEQVELQELAHQQHGIHNALRSLLAQLPELLADVPAENQYTPLRGDVKAFLQAVADAKIDGDLSGAADALDEPDASKGYALAQLAALKMDQLIARCNALPPEGQACLLARFRPTLVRPGIGNTLGQILAALGAGNGEGGRNGYALFNEAVALYGPNTELAGEQGRRRSEPGTHGAARVEQVAGTAADQGLPPPQAASRVRLQPQARFPLRYRNLVGEYFRVIAESQEEGANQ